MPTPLNIIFIININMLRLYFFHVSCHHRIIFCTLIGLFRLPFAEKDNFFNLSRTKGRRAPNRPPNALLTARAVT